MKIASYWKTLLFGQGVLGSLLFHHDTESAYPTATGAIHLISELGCGTGSPELRQKLYAHQTACAKVKRRQANPKRGLGFEEVQEVFSRPYWLD